VITALRRLVFNGGLALFTVLGGVRPIVAGAITGAIDWHWIFWINVPIGLAAVVLGLRLLPESHGAPERLDLIGVSLVAAGVFALVWSLIRADRFGWASADIVGPLAAGCLLLAARSRRAGSSWTSLFSSPASASRWPSPKCRPPS
jgi:hypothetical protein